MESLSFILFVGHTQSPVCLARPRSSSLLYSLLLSVLRLPSSFLPQGLCMGQSSGFTPPSSLLPPPCSSLLLPSQFLLLWVTHLFDTLPCCCVYSPFPLLSCSFSTLCSSGHHYWWILWFMFSSVMLWAPEHRDHVFACFRLAFSWVPGSCVSRAHSRTQVVLMEGEDTSLGRRALPTADISILSHQLLWPWLVGRL